MNPRNIDTARLLANMNYRAQRLFEDGYTFSRVDEWDVIVTNNEGAKYEVSTLFDSCECPCYYNHGNCKHLIGWSQLEKDQKEYEEHLCSQYQEPDDYAKAVYEESLYRRMANGATV